MSKTTYAEVGGKRYGFTPTVSGGDSYVMITTRTANLGLFRLDRFGEDPLTPAGRLASAAIRTFASEPDPES